MQLSVEDAHVVVDSIASKSPRCMAAWSSLSPLLFRACRTEPVNGHMLTIALHQIEVFAREYRKSGVADDELLRIATRVLGGQSPGGDEINVDTLPPKKRMLMETQPISVLQ